MTKNKNSKWTRDETILALYFYLEYAPSVPEEIIEELSKYLRKIQTQILGNKDTPSLRNKNGMRMKMGNFLYLDNSYPDQKGLSGASKLDKQVFNEFVNNRSKLLKISQQIIRMLDENNLGFVDIDEGEYEASEGGIKVREHRYRERDQKITKLKKEEILKEKGELACQVCGFSFENIYGERGRNFIECHHIKEISNMSLGEVTRLEDLVLICSNCHRMIHRKKPWLSIGELKALIDKK